MESQNLIILAYSTFKPSRADSDPSEEKKNGTPADLTANIFSRHEEATHQGEQNNHNLFLGTGSIFRKASRYLRVSINVLPSQATLQALARDATDLISKEMEFNQQKWLFNQTS